MSAKMQTNFRSNHGIVCVYLQFKKAVLIMTVMHVPQERIK